MPNFEEIDAGCKYALHLRLLNSLEDTAEGNCPSLRKSNSLAINAMHEVGSSLANPVFDGKVWSSKGFKSFASSKNVNASPRLSSSWIQRLKPASHGTRLEESRDMKDMCIDMKTNTCMANQCGTPATVYENSRRSKQDFYSSPYAVIASDQYSRALRAATSRSLEGAKVPQELQLEVCVAPRFLPTVKALLPNYSHKVDARTFATERRNLCTSAKCTWLSNEVKQVVLFSADERPRVSCSSIKGADFPSAFSTRVPTNYGTEYSFSTKSFSERLNLPNPRGMVEAAASERRHLSTMGSKYDWELDKDYHTEKGIIGGSLIRNKFSFVEKRIEESMAKYTCQDNTVLMNYKAMSEEIQAGDLSCYQMHALDANKLCESQQKQLGVCFHVAENALACPSEHVPNLSCQRLEQRSTNLTENSRQENGHSSFATARETNSNESLDCRSPCPLPSDSEATFETAQKRFCGKQNLSLPNAAKEDFMSTLLNKTNLGAGAGAGADADGHGVHCFTKTESGYKVTRSKEEETGHMHALQRQSDWSNRMGYKSCGSYSDSCELSSTLNEQIRLPDGHSLPPVLRKRSWDHDNQTAGPFSNVFYEEKSLAKRKLWMQRWCTASPKQNSQCHPDVSREFKTFAGLSPFSEGGDGAKTGSILCSSDNLAVKPAKRTCHGSLQYTSKKVLSGFESASQARQYRAVETSSHFLKRFFTPSAAAMAIMGTTARQVHDTQPQRKGLFGMWAAPKPSTFTTPLAQAETCKDLKTLSKSLEKSLVKG